MYKHLTYEQRYYIFTAKESGKSIDKIAKEIKMHRSTIFRELKRNRYTGYKYYHKAAKLILEERQKKRYHRAFVLTPKLCEKIIECLNLGWSPEQISGRLKRKKTTVSTQTIYRFIHKDKKCGGKLYKKLRHKGKKYKTQSVGERVYRIKDRVGIEKRPKIIDQKRRIGDWEIDTVVGRKHRSAILTIVDRKSKFTVIEKLSGKTMKSVTYQTIKRLKKLPKKSITADNGTEFSGHKDMTNSLKIPVYFADPYASWQRGLNEHTNGLIREYLPKKTDFREITREKLYEIEKNLNSRPRKVLGYRTPEEMMRTYTKRVALLM